MTDAELAVHLADMPDACWSNRARSGVFSAKALGKAETPRPTSSFVHALREAAA